MSECPHGHALRRKCNICDREDDQAKIAALEKRIAVAVAISRSAIVAMACKRATMEEILTMPQSDFDKFCAEHPEYLP